MRPYYIKETLITTHDADLEIHPIAPPITILPPEVMRLLYSGGKVLLYVPDTRNLDPLVAGIILCNMVVSKNTRRPYPDFLVEKSLWKRELISQARRFLFYNIGYEAGLMSLLPSEFIFLSERSIESGIEIIRVSVNNNCCVACICPSKN